MLIPLPILKHARLLAERKGAVLNGHHWFEGSDGREIRVEDLVSGVESTEDVCHVCITGALLLASIEKGEPLAWGSIAVPAGEAALRVLLELPGTKVSDASECLTGKVSELGTPYLVSVLDEMIERATDG